MTTNTNKSSLYVVVLLLEASITRPNYEPLYEESFLLIRADSEEGASKKAMQQSNQPLSYQNQYGETVTWTLKEVVEAKEINEDKLVDGTEIFSRFFRNYDAYNAALQQKFED
jgi:hypothetical protein